VWQRYLIIALYRGFSKDYLEKHFNSGIVRNISNIEKKDCCNDYMNQDNFTKLHFQIKELCNKNNAKFFEINDDYVGEMKNVYKWIDEQIGEL
jgi:putative acetyltransferase